MPNPFATRTTRAAPTTTGMANPFAPRTTRNPMDNLLDPRAAPGYRGPQGGPRIDPFSTWSYADPNDRSYRYFDDATKQFYQDNKQAAYGQFITDQFGTQQTPLLAYAQGQYNRAYQDYLRANETDPTLMFTDVLDKNFVNSLRNSFYMQSPSNKGYAIQWMPQGRYTG